MIEIDLFADLPITCDNFVRLCLNGYSGSCFHRVITGFAAQGGRFNGFI